MNTAFLAIDFINDIVSPDGKIASVAKQVEERSVIQKANQALKIARDHQWLIMFVKVGFSTHYVEQPKNSPFYAKVDQLHALTLGEWGTDFHAALEVKESDPIVIKHRISPFYGTNLEVVLKANQIDRLVICGVSTTWAIQATAREGHDRDYQMVIVEEACAAASQEEHQASIQQLSRIAQIVSLAELENH